MCSYDAVQQGEQGPGATVHVLALLCVLVHAQACAGIR